MSQYKFRINGKEYEVSVNGINGSNADVTVNGVGYNVEIEGGPATGGSASQTTAQDAARPQTPAPLAETKTAKGSGNTMPAGGKKITSPLPGVVIEVCVKEGEVVKKGQKLVILEAMKMENEILAEADGSVSKLCVNKGDSVLEGADIAIIA